MNLNVGVKQYSNILKTNGFTLFFLFFFVIFQYNFDEFFDRCNYLSSLFVREMGKHGVGLYFLHGEVMLPCYIFLVNVFHGDWVMGLSLSSRNKHTII